MTDEDKILAFRKAYEEIPDNYKKREVNRLVNQIQNKPFIVLEDSDIGKVIKFLDVASLMEYFWKEKGIRVDKSYIYKVLRGQYDLAYGYKVYQEKIE